MTKGDFIIIGVHCNYLSFAKGNKLGAIRHLRKMSDSAQELSKERRAIADLKKDAKPKELEEAYKEFDAEEYTAGMAVIPAEWFDAVSNDIVTLTTNKGETFDVLPFNSFDFLMKQGVIK